MTRIRWSTEAADELQAIVEHIRQDSPKAALDTAQAVFNRVKEHDDVAEILHIWHGAQDWR